MKKQLVVVTSSFPAFAMSLALAACGGSNPHAESAVTRTTSATADDVGSMSPQQVTAASSSGPGSMMDPSDPGLPSFERRTTSEIQRRLLSDDALSATAKNVEVVTVGRKVTLRGEVKSQDEKAIIEGHVRRSLGVTELDDQLQIVK
jgi:osmotically-inducible protein OsmY